MTDTALRTSLGLAAEGREQGHRVMVTPLGPSFVVECTCADFPEGRRASKHAANLAGLAHLRAVLR